MAQSAERLLESLWSGVDLDKLTCCQCGERIPPDTGLAQTFLLESQEPNGLPHARRFDVPALSETILIYHRHFECLFESVRYASISHVWDTRVAGLQNGGHAAGTAVEEVVKLVLETPVKICLGLSKGLGHSCEIWHDYISVPQWQHEAKNRIIRNIPETYHRAHLTVAHLSDVDAATIGAMRHGYPIDKVCRAVSDLCNAQWFSRVWTAMEYTQSRDIRTMVKDFILVDHHETHRPLFREMEEAWEEQNKRMGTNKDAEHIVGMGHNLVPWQLGPLEVIRQQNLQGVRPIFGSAHELLARRGVTFGRDFFHGLLGILGGGMAEPDLSKDATEAMLQVARDRITRGDFSPLLMVPASSMSEPDAYDLQSLGYTDLLTFALGAQKAPPTFTDASLRSGNPTLKLEYLGDVQHVKQLFAAHGDPNALPEMLEWVLAAASDDVGAFTKTLARLYGMEFEGIIRHLREQNLEEPLKARLGFLRASGGRISTETADWIAETTGLSSPPAKHSMTHVSPLSFMHGHGGSLHFGSAGGVVSVRCPACDQIFLIRIGLLRKEAHFRGARAYRIPGLGYRFTLPGGTGFIVKDGRVIGRILWGVPTCDCEKVEEAEIVLQPLPLPHPNPYPYGKEKDGGYVTLRLHDRIILD
ncbi:hypothetical protein IMZ48_11875, partial [Candidatus Bathyarchaeota archaeon]|nr:hypothetical protein [Candidatus Bathyarchaeota archaeon]